MSQNDEKQKYEELQALLTKIEKKVRVQRTVNFALWAVIVGLCTVYALYVPKLAKEVLSSDSGPRVLTQVARNMAPTPEKLVAKVQENIPGMVERGLDAAENYLGKLETGALAEFDKSTDRFFEQLSQALQPMVRQAIHEEMPKIRELMEKAKRDETHEAVSDYVAEAFRRHLAVAVKDFDTALDEIYVNLTKYESDRNSLTKKQLAERQLLVSLARMSQEPSVQEALGALHENK